MIVFPNAKINIGLNVVSKRCDGYHNIETVFYPLKLYDVLEFVVAEKTELSVTGIKIDENPDNNLVLKAYRVLKKHFNLPEIKFHLQKNIPFCAGLGGGSSDAAFTLKALNLFLNLGISEEKLKDYATMAGADCPFFIENKPAFATETGNKLTPVNIELAQYKIVILKPPVEVSTLNAYKNISPVKPDFNLKNLCNLPVEKWKETVTNDFEKYVFRVFPVVRELKEKLYEAGALYASMSGSGSAVYGIFSRLPVNFEKLIPKGILIYQV
ncbi:MAG: 4-(cytidine 5'-diphospho)-2-C-methyl-D-erythritol kinase [Bacteroidales bacterium]|jgi:4-diphosphocytidyl-2-C-methyl-D-erythritol kinase|nr:4-(cytidine 5'-diphospho)-2-C-methyl-D-erythritol kinase [Bacteroidales bacterium]